jgi:hypothetical protein
MPRGQIEQFKGLKNWAKGFEDRVRLAIHTDMMDDAVAAYLPRLKKDLDRIAAARLAEASIATPLEFTITWTGRRELTITPSDPILFKTLEFGEFNPDGTLKTPPNSILTEWRVAVRI